jgi:hypothetical protein
MEPDMNEQIRSKIAAEENNAVTWNKELVWKKIAYEKPAFSFWSWYRVAAAITAMVLMSSYWFGIFNKSSLGVEQKVAIQDNVKIPPEKSVSDSIAITEIPTMIINEQKLRKVSSYQKLETRSQDTVINFIKDSTQIFINNLTAVIADSTRLGDSTQLKTNTEKQVVRAIVGVIPDTAPIQVTVTKKGMIQFDLFKIEEAKTGQSTEAKSIIARIK